MPYTYLSERGRTRRAGPFLSLGRLNDPSVLLHVVEPEAGNVLNHIRLRHSVKVAVDDAHVLNRGTLETPEIQSILGFARLQIADFQIPDNRNEVSRFPLFGRRSRWRMPPSPPRRRRCFSHRCSR